MFDHLFRRNKIPRLPVTTAELSEALRVAAKYADGESAQLEYNRAADALDRAIVHTKRHADAPTRDAVAYALGRAELNLQDQLRDLIEVSRETHLLVQGVHSAQSEQGAAVGELRAEFQSFGKSLTELESRIRTSDDDRRDLRQTINRHHEESHADRERIQNQLNALETDVRAAMSQALGSARVDELVAMIERHETILTGDATEAGG